MINKYDSSIRGARSIDIVKGGKRAVIGEKRQFAGKWYEKTQKGWRLMSKNNQPRKDEGPSIYGHDLSKKRSTSLMAGTEGFVRDLGNEQVEKTYNNNDRLTQGVLRQYQKMVGVKSDYLCNITSVDLKQGKIVMEKLDVHSPKLDKLRIGDKALWSVGLDEFTILEEGLRSDYVQSRLKKIQPLEKYVAANQYAILITKMNAEGNSHGISVDDFNIDNFGVDKDGRIKMFDYMKRTNRAAGL